MLSQGSAELLKLADVIRRVGGEVDEQIASSSDKFMRLGVIFGAAWDGIKRELARPVIEAAAKNYDDLVESMVVGARIIRSVIIAAWEGLLAALGKSPDESMLQFMLRLETWVTGQLPRIKKIVEDTAKSIIGFIGDLTLRLEQLLATIEKIQKFDMKDWANRNINIASPAFWGGSEANRQYQAGYGWVKGSGAGGAPASAQEWFNSMWQGTRPILSFPEKASTTNDRNSALLAEWYKAGENQYVPVPRAADYFTDQNGRVIGDLTDSVKRLNRSVDQNSAALSSTVAALASSQQVDLGSGANDAEILRKMATGLTINAPTSVNFDPKMAASELAAQILPQLRSAIDRATMHFHAAQVSRTVLSGL